TGVLESSTEKCPVCGGTGHMRSVSSVALQLLRSLEEMLIKGATHNLVVRTRAEVAIYVLNHKRAHLRDLEQRFRVTITVNADAAIAGQQSFVIDKGEQVHTLEAARAIAIQPTTVLPEHEEETAEEVEEEAEIEQDEEAEAEEDAAADFEPRPDVMQGEPRHAEHGDGARRRGRRRRRRGGGGRREGGEPPYEAAPRPEQGAYAGPPPEERGGENYGYPREGAGGESYADGEHRRRRRGRRGGRRRRGREGEPFEATPSSFEPELDSAVADFDHPSAPAHNAYTEPVADEQPPAPPQSEPATPESAPAQAEAPPAEPEPPPPEPEAP